MLESDLPSNEIILNDQSQASNLSGHTFLEENRDMIASNYIKRSQRSKYYEFPHDAML